MSVTRSDRRSSSIESRNLAELLIAQEREFFVGGEFRRLALVGQAFLDEPGARVALVENRAHAERRKRDHDEHEKCNESCGHRITQNLN